MCKKQQPVPTENEQCGYIGLPHQKQCSRQAYLRIVIQPDTPEEDYYYFCECHAGYMAVLLTRDPPWTEAEY